MENVVCKISGRVRRENEQSKTVDGEKITKEVYDAICLQLRKGLFTLEEGVKEWESMKEYLKMIDELSIGARQLIEELNSEEEIINSIIEAENKKAIEKYNTERKLLKVSQHKEIVKELLKTYPVDNNKKRPEKNHQKFMRKYNPPKEYHEVRKAIRQEY